MRSLVAALAVGLAVCSLPACTALLDLKDVPDPATGGASQTGGTGGTSSTTSSAGTGGAGTGGTSTGGATIGGAGGQTSSGGSMSTTSSGGAGGVAKPASCDVAESSVAGITDCGTSLQDCCTSLPVPGGSFKRSYDGVTYLDDSHPATVSPFLLDKFEVTVARFRRFVMATVNEGWKPPAGSGKHTHLNGGAGLTEVSSGSPEPGWDPAWNGAIPSTLADWMTSLRTICNNNDGLDTWSETPDPIWDHQPITCVQWHQAYAFCIWDGGFLPSEAEWNFAASGGDAQNVFAWGNDPIACDRVMSNQVTCPDFGHPKFVGHYPAGNSVYGHADLAGNMFEWGLDTHIVPLSDSCVDCVQLQPSDKHTLRGGSWVYGFDASYFYSADRPSASVGVSGRDIGVRCARAL